MTPSAFLLVFRAAESHAIQLPDAPAIAGFDDMERKRCFKNAMPLAWQDKFDDANLSIEVEALNDMRAYFDNQHLRNPFEQRENGGNPQRIDGGGPRAPQQPPRGRNRNNRNRHNRPPPNAQTDGGNPRNGRQPNPPRRIQNTDACPLPNHGGHLWGDCRSNRYGFEWERNRNNPPNGGRPGGGRNQQRGDAHLVNPRRQGRAPNSRRGRQQQQQETDVNSDDEVYMEVNLLEQAEFCIECSDPESYLYDGQVQEIFEEQVTEQHDDLPTPVLPSVDYVPSTLAIVKQINSTKGNFLLKSLLDHGGSHVLVRQSSIPKEVALHPIVQGAGFDTAAGALKTKFYVHLHDVILPEFSFSRRVKTTKAFVFDNDAIKYDCIFGRSFWSQFPK